MDTETYVYLDINGAPRLVGRLWSRVRRGRESASFQYDDQWLTDPERFALEPALTLGPGAHHTPAGKAMFGALGDSAPDRWGRTLMARAERRTARNEERAPRTLTELDYLLRVSDRSRQGSLRFAAEADGEFLSTACDEAVPPLIELPRLLAASDRMLLDDDDDELLAMLLAPGSSLGGARPKASVLDSNGVLSIAKFPKQDDEVDTVRWEALALTLARRAGIAAPNWRLEPLDDRFVIILTRFDRNADERIPFLSAMSMIGASDGEDHSYLEIADAIRQHGAAANEDLAELWRRIVFSVLISNTDDHLRNHGFLYSGNDGWRLSPAYDLNPVPIDLKPRFLSTAIDLVDTEASIDLALTVAPYFGLDADGARAIATDVARTVSEWRRVATNLGLSKAAIGRMASAFEHDDLTRALAL
ncbi:MAG: type II toxin-antitoxin system HipA family toxin [Gammaproteobacteria bacterium]|nr:MAG: type II toxin-antitoxin system HipA family toxin [Gammaproteobacteria bacterium]